MSTKNIVESLISEMEKMPVIDSHEHLPYESELIAKNADIFTRIYTFYSLTNANSAGMKQTREFLYDETIPLEKRWKEFKPYLSAIKDTGYALSAQITARELYGIEDINDDTYQLLSERVAKTNKVGLYDSILKDKCNVETVLNQGTWSDKTAIGVYRGFYSELYYANKSKMDLFINMWEKRSNCRFSKASDLIEYAVKWVSEGNYVGIKFDAAFPPLCIEDDVAQNLYAKYKTNTLDNDECTALGNWFLHKTLEFSAKYHLVVAIHCGIICNVWGDFTQLHPLNIIPILIKYKDTTFDLYHGGIPWVRDIAVMGNQYPNANLNMVWCHQISPFMTQNMINEWIDLVPANKIIGFAGDHCNGPEKTYGVYKLTLENIARALAIRLERGLMTQSRAIDICKMWLYDNPKTIYNL